NDRNDRENIRKAFLDVIQAHPETADVAARWHAGMWQCFYDVQELGKGHALLNEVLLKRGASFRKHIPESYMPHLEDIFFYWISHKHPDKAIAWLKKAAQQTKIPEQKNGLKIRMAEVNMYHKKNFTEARRILKTQTLSSRSHAIVATIRLGDVAFLAGNLNEANRYWGKVENKTDVAEAIAADAEGVRWAGEAARSGEISSERSKMLGMTRRAGGNRKQDWRKEAVLDSNISTSINSLLKQGYFEEALQELTLWERFFPMSKLTEDFILLEARCYMAMDNISRARTLLEAYCNVVEASSFLPDAAELLENCMKNQRAPKSELKAFYEKMSKRLEYHPTGQRMKERLEYL
ncbi:MAG: hypothetical protein QF886_13000, partial [Planctomycetota bacterium]|nr:hypothetical protein [Planctomycetota bacterium]